MPHADRCLVMGVLNVTPDSFSDGGRYTTTESAVAHGLSCGPPAPTTSTSGASPPGPAPDGSTRPPNAAGCCPWSPSWRPPGRP
jgi:hypothetical protein